MIRQLIVIEDHAIFRAGLISLVENLSDVSIAEAASVEAALASAIVPHLILLDIQLSGMSGLEGMVDLRQRWPDVSIIVISANDSYANAQAALRAGASAFLSKSDASQTISSVISKALDNRLADKHISTTVQKRVEMLPKLTERQIEVMQLLAQGYSNKTIGQMLHISENTIRWHVCAMISALQVSSRTEAVFVARNLGLVN